VVTLGDAKIDYRRHARACERIIQTAVTSRHQSGAGRGLDEKVSQWRNYSKEYNGYL